MKKLVLSALLLGTLQGYACEDLVGTYYCGDLQDGYPQSVYRITNSFNNLKVEIGLFSGSKMIVRRQAGTGSLRQDNSKMVTELTRCSKGAISTLSRMSDEGRIVLSTATHLVKKGNQVTAHYASVQPSRTGVTERRKAQESCRKVSMTEDVWTRTKAAAALIISLVTGKGPYGN